MTMALIDIARSDFKTSRAADELSARFQTLLGLPHRYGPARLALGRSISLPTRPTLELTTLGFGRPIKGEQLFGQGVEQLTWLTMIWEHTGTEQIKRREFQNAVAAHWHRGIYLLWDDWKASAGDFDAFVARLVRYSQGKPAKARQLAI